MPGRLGRAGASVHRRRPRRLVAGAVSSAQSLNFFFIELMIIPCRRYTLIDQALPIVAPESEDPRSDIVPQPRTKKGKERNQQTVCSTTVHSPIQQMSLYTFSRNVKCLSRSARFVLAKSCFVLLGANLKK